MRSSKSINQTVDAYNWPKIVGKIFIKNVKKHSFITFDCLKK